MVFMVNLLNKCSIAISLGRMGRDATKLIQSEFRGDVKKNNYLARSPPPQFMIRWNISHIKLFTSWNFGKNVLFLCLFNEQWLE